VANKEPVRYYFTGLKVTDYARFLSAVLIVSSLVIMLVLRTAVGYAIFGLSAAAGAYGIFRRPRPGFYVELNDDCLAMKVLFKRRIPYPDIESAAFYKNEYGEIRQALEKFAVRWNHLFGGQFEEVIPRGQTDPRTLVLRFRRTHWAIILFPPFLLPMRAWKLLPMAHEDAASLRAEIARRIPPDPIDPRDDA
jgi:hypothetical protein